MNVVSVVLSDTHLGSAHSVLDPDAAARSGQTYPDHLESVLFAPLKRALPNGKAKFLVLNGDTIDFSLQTFQQALLRAAGFMQKIVASQIFEEIIYIPGNHDHNVWQLLQHEVTVTRRVAAGLPPKPYPYVQAGLLDLTQSTLSLPNVGSPYGDVFLKGLFHLGAPAGPDADELPIAVVYPNLFMFTQGSPDRPILATHGHLFCLPWILLTEVFTRLKPLPNPSASTRRSRSWGGPRWGKRARLQRRRSRSTTKAARGTRTSSARCSASSRSTSTTVSTATAHGIRGSGGPTPASRRSRRYCCCW